MKLNPSNKVTLHGFLLKLLCLALWVSIGLLGVTANAQVAQAGWPKVNGNAANTGRAVGSGGIPTVRWINASLTYANVLIGPDGTMYYRGGEAINGTTGSVIWSQTSQYQDGVLSALDQSGLIFGFEGSSTSANLLAVNSLNGTLVWSVPLTGPPTTGLAIGTDGSLYLQPKPADGVSNLFSAFNPKTGTIKWSYPLTYQATGTPGVGPDGTVYFYSEDKIIRALSPTDGTLKWKYTIPSQYQGANYVGDPVIGPDGTIYFTLLSGLNGGTLFALDSTTGSLLWTYQNQYLYSNVVLGLGNTAYVELEDANHSTSFQPELASLDTQNGEVLWTASAGEAFDTYPTVDANGIVYLISSVGSQISALLTFDGTTGNPLWNFQLPFQVNSVLGGNDIAIGSDGSICFGTSAGLYCLDSIHINSFTISPTTVWGGVSSAGTVSLSAPAPAGGANITFTETSSVAGLPASVTVPAGQTSVTFPITTSAVSAKTEILIQAFPGVNQTATLTVNPPALSGLSLSPTTVVGGSPSTGTVTLGNPAGPSGSVISLTSGNAAASVPTTVTVAPGKTSATFSVTTNAVDAVTPAVITATLGSNAYSQTLTINPAGLVSVLLNPTALQGGSPSTGTVTVSGPAGPSGLTVGLSSSSSSATLPASVTIAPGQTSATFTVATTPVSAQVQAVITGTVNKVPQTATLTINPATLVSINLNPTSVLGGNTSTGTVTLSGASPTGGTSVALSSGNSSATVPSSLVVPAGQTTASFTVSTTPVVAQTSAVITATLNKFAQTASLTITPEVLSSVTLSPPSVQGGASSMGTVTLSSPSPTGGTSVALSSGNAAAVVPTSVTVAAGQTTATFTVTTSGVNTQTSAVITGTLNNKPQTATLTITPAALFSISLSPASVQGGTPSTGTVTLSGPAGSGGTTISLSSNTPAATVPTSVTVSAGQTTATFKVTTLGVNAKTTSIISGTLNGTSQTANLTITPVGIQSFSLSPTTVFGGNASTGTITLNGPAGIGGSTVTLGSSSSSVTPPGSLTIPQGQMSASFQVQTSAVSSTVAATLTANLNGTTSSALLTVTAPVLQSLTISPSSLAGAGTATGTVTFSGVAPASGITVSLLSSSSSATVPSSVKVPAGQISVSFSISAISVTASTTVTISATANFVSKSATLTLNPIQLMSFTLDPSTVNGGASSTGTVSLNGPAGKGGLVVHLKSSLVGVTVPATLPIAAGQTSATFKVATVGVSVQKVATVMATLGTVTETATLTVNPPVLSGISLNPSSVTGSLSSTGTVTLSGAAPSTGMVVKLLSSSTSATLPVSVTIPSGKSSATFSIKTLAVPTQTSASISGSLNGVTESATLTINPPAILTFLVMPASVKGGSTSTGRITLNAVAPKGGLVISLSAGQSDATVPTTLTIAAGRTTGTFTIKTGKVTVKTSATITATATATTKSAVLTITP